MLWQRQLSHVHRTRDVVIKNDAKLRNDANTDILDDNLYRDQGFTRPKVLSHSRNTFEQNFLTCRHFIYVSIFVVSLSVNLLLFSFVLLSWPQVLFLLPLKSSARRVVKRLIQLSPLTQKVHFYFCSCSYRQHLNIRFI
jgi:U3 small nucleolar RNA-associated protein 25